MSNVIRVKWTISPKIAPQPWRACGRCGEQRPFRCSGKFRLNANGKRLDAWLIYKCTACDETWNRTVIERRAARDFDPNVLAGFEANDPALVGRFAFDVAALRKASHRVEEFAEVEVRKELPDGTSASNNSASLEIGLRAPMTVPLRLDRLLASELGLARSRVEHLEECGRLSVWPNERRALRRPLRNGMLIVLDLTGEPDAPRIVAAATG